MSHYQSNSYLDVSALDQNFMEAQKAQERLAIKSILIAKEAKIKSQKNALTTKLNIQKTKMSDFAGKTVASNFKEGLTGKSAEAADKHLTSKKFDPKLKSPIK